MLKPHSVGNLYQLYFTLNGLEIENFVETFLVQDFKVYKQQRSSNL